MKRILSAFLAAALAVSLLAGSAAAAAPAPWVQADGLGTASQTISLRGLSGSCDAVQITLALDRAPSGFTFDPSLSGEGCHTAFTVDGNSITLYVTSRDQLNLGDAVLLGVLTSDRAFQVTSASKLKLLDLDGPSEQERSYAAVGVGAPAALPFTDVPETEWYYDAVVYAYQAELMNGVTATTFNPLGSTTRGMIVTILWRMEGEPVVNYLLPFPDVAQGLWYTEAIRWATSNLIVRGFPNGQFRPEDPITREQMAAILYNYAKYKGYDVSGRANLSALFPDAAQVNAYAVDALSWANHAKLINGEAKGSAVLLNPLGSATRAQAAAILMRFRENIAK